MMSGNRGVRFGILMVGLIVLGPGELRAQALPGAADELSGVLTYVRREWGHGADPVSPETVRAILEQASGRRRPWTVAELLKVPE